MATGPATLVRLVGVIDDLEAVRKIAALPLPVLFEWELLMPAEGRPSVEALRSREILAFVVGSEGPSRLLAYAEAIAAEAPQAPTLVLLIPGADPMLEPLLPLRPKEIADLRSGFDDPVSVSNLRVALANLDVAVDDGGSAAPSSEQDGSASLASSALSSASDQPPDWQQLGGAARAALALADAFRLASRQSQVHMEHLLAGLYEFAPGPLRKAVADAGLSDQGFKDLLVEASRGRLTDVDSPSPSTLAGLPKLSRHVVDALVEARQIAAGQQSDVISDRHLVAGALSISGCAPVELLLKAGVSLQGVLRWDGPSSTAALTVEASAQTDQPTPFDLLGFSTLVDALAELLNGPDTTFPLTIAISAPWGSGKSSVMRQLAVRLENRGGTGPGWVIVYFPAWRYETGEQLWAAMAKACYDAGLASRKGLRDRWAFRWALERRRLSMTELLGRGALAAVGGIISVAATLSLGSAADLPAEPKIGAAAVAGLGALVGTAKAIWGSLENPFKSAIEALAAKPAIAAGDGFTTDAAAQVDALMTELLSNDGRLAVFIDDLDRCAPRNLVRVIEAVNQIFVAGSDVVATQGGTNAGEAAKPETHARRLAFVMGMDRYVVARGIEAEYAALLDRLTKTGDAAGGDFGLAFLDKIIQLWVTLPTPTPAALEVLLRNIAGFPSTTGPDNQGEINRFRQAILDAVRAVGTDDRSAVIAAARGVEQGAPEASKRAAAWARQSVLSAYPAPNATESPEVWDAMRLGAACLELNPRQFKRFNNAFRLQLNLAARSGGVTFSADQLGGLARLVAIRMRWSLLAHAFDEYPSLLAALEREANGRRFIARISAAEAAAQRKATPMWFDATTFSELPALLEVLRVDHAAQAISRLPFEAFVRIA